jgi:preprotein translocase SecE subunit
VARERKRPRRASRANRPGARVPPQRAAGSFGLPEGDPAVDPTLDAEESWPTASSAFPQAEPFAGDPITSTAAAAAFGEEEHPLRDEERPQRDERVAVKGSRVIGFLRGCWAELQRVQWPDRQQVVQATGVVLGFVVIAGAFLGLADEVSQQIVNAIL